MTTFVLVHGAMHGGWCWERVVPLLESRGAKVIAPDLPGMGADKTPLESLDFEAWARFVADIARAQSEPVVLVGHSRGSAVISQAAELAPEAVRQLIYLATVVAEDGKSLLEAISGKVSEGDLTGAMQPNRETAPQAFYHTSPPEWGARAAGLLTPEPNFGIYTRVKLSAARFGRVPKAFIETVDDKVIPIALQRASQQKNGVTAIATLEGDHSPFYGRPEELTEALLRLAR